MQCIKDTIKNINIVIGCNIGCSYCYARMNNNRFHTIDDFNKPVFFENKLKMLDNKRHTAYLLTGQSDLSGWNEEWKDKVFSKMKENENTQYIFLTKRPENINLKETPDNGWFGVTVTSSKEKTRIDYLRNNIKAKHYHITFEPMFDDVGKLDLNNISDMKELDAVVVAVAHDEYKNKDISQSSELFGKGEKLFVDIKGIFNKEDIQDNGMKYWSL